MIAATYDIEVDAPEDIFDGYIEALTTAFTHLEVDNTQLISVIDDIYYESADQVYGVTINPS